MVNNFPSNRQDFDSQIGYLDRGGELEYKLNKIYNSQKAVLFGIFLDPPELYWRLEPTNIYVKATMKEEEEKHEEKQKGKTDTQKDNEEDNDDSHGLSSGEIILIIISVIIFCLVSIYCCKRYCCQEKKIYPIRLYRFQD